MTRWSALVVACVVLWTTETILPQDEGRQIEERVAMLACLEGNGERFLEVRRTVQFRGFPGDPIRTVVELRLPWGAEKAPEKAPVKAPP